MNEEHLDEHSQAKLQMYKQYLQKYLQVIGNSPYFSTINIYDFFCGKGVYENGIGSPLISAECIYEAKQKWQQNKIVNLCVNDIDEKKVTDVKTVLLGDAKYKCINFECLSKDFLSVCSDLSAKRFSTDVHSLFFIDPYGYKNITKELLLNLMNIGKVEIILFLPVSFIFRFIKKTTDDIIENAFIPIKNFVDTLVSKQPYSNVMSFIGSIKEGLAFNDKLYTDSYYIERGKGQYFALFFMTKNLRGLEKIVEAKWDIDPINGLGFDKDEEKGLFDDQFKDDRLNTLKNIILDHTKHGITNDRLFSLTLKSGFLPKHANKIVNELSDKLTVSEIATGKPAKGNYISYKDYKNGARVMICKK